MRLEAERRRLREALEAAEARGTRVELGRRSLEGELQRFKLSLGDREAESQASHERHDSLLKQVWHADMGHVYVTLDLLNCKKVGMLCKMYLKTECKDL